MSSALALAPDLDYKHEDTSRSSNQGFGKWGDDVSQNSTQSETVTLIANPHQQVSTDDVTVSGGAPGLWPR